jgi:hypothetical protein
LIFLGYISSRENLGKTQGKARVKLRWLEFF